MFTKAVKRSLTGILILVMLLVAIICSLRLRSVQKWLIDRVLARLEQKYEGKISLGGVYIRWPHRVELSRLLILDPLNDTLLYAPTASFSANKLNIDESKLNFGSVVLEDPVIRLKQLPSGKMNVDLLLEALSSSDTSATAKPFSLSANEIILHKGLFQYKKFGSLNKPGRVNWDDILLHHLEISVKHFEYNESTIQGRIELLSCAEQSGFVINKLSSGVVVDSAGIHTDHLTLLTGNSRISSVKATVTGLKPLPGQPVDPMLDLVLGSDTYLSPIDLTLLTGINIGFTIPLDISGSFTGSLKNARLLNASLNWPELFSFEGDMVYNFPGALNKAFFDLKTRSLVLNVQNLINDVLSGQIPGFELKVPEIIQNLNVIEYNGVFTGTFENFMTSGNWLIADGEITTNLDVKKNVPMPGYNIKGSVAATDLNPDIWLKKTTGISAIAFNMDVDGVWDGEKSVNARLDGQVDEFTMNGYTFQNLCVSGRASENWFEGSLGMKDPNLNFDLAGTFDLGQKNALINFNLLINKANLYALNLSHKDTLSNLQLDMRGQLQGNVLDELEGVVTVKNASFSNSRGTLPINDLVLSSVPEYGKQKITLSSEYVDARIVGDIHLDDLSSQVKFLLARFIPTLSRTQSIRPDHLNDFVFNIQLKNASPVAKILLPGFQCKDNTRLNGSYKAGGQVISIEGISPQFVMAGSQFTGTEIHVQSKGDSLILSGGIDKVQLDKNNVFEKIVIGGSLSENQLSALLNWNSNGKAGTRGKIGCTGLMTKTENGDLRSIFNFPSAELVYNDSLWKIDPFQITTDRNTLTIKHLAISHQAEKIGVDGTISASPADTLFVDCKRLDLDIINHFTGANDLKLGGSLTGELRLFDMKNKGMFFTEARIDSFAVNDQSLGLATISSRNAGSGEPVSMDVLIQRGSLKTLQLRGQFNPGNSGLNFDLDLDKLRMDILNPFVADELLDVKGLATGKIKVRGTLKDPLVSGNVMLQKASFIVNYLNTRFYLTHNVIVTPDAFSLINADVQDEEGNHSHVSGAVRHDKFRNIRLDLDMSYKNFLVLNEVESRNMGYWGRGYATGVASIKGPLKSLMIDISAQSSPKTKFYVPVATTEEAQNVDFITYETRQTEEVDQDLLDFSDKRPEDYQVNLFGATVNIDMEATPDAEVQLIFDEKVGNAIQAKGNGNLRVVIPPTSGFTLTGDYTIEEGEYQFTLQNMPVKRLKIEPGATLKWTGDATNTQLDIDAVYNTKASLYDLLQDETNTELTQRLPVECHLLLTGYLSKPSLDYNIVLPVNSNDLARTQLQNLTREETSKQVISLLLLNRFQPLQGTSSGTTRGYESAGISTTTEMLSNQLNYWISQISKDFDVGFNYRPGDQLSSDEVEVALTKQFLDNRITVNVNGNYDVKPTTTNNNANQLVGDVDVEFKIKQSGKVRVKVFTRANDHLLYEYAPYTQGVGLFYREEFNTFGDLVRKYKDKWFGK